MDMQMSVQIREGKLRTSPSFLAAILGTLRYGDRVSLLKDNGDWMKILDAGSGKAGWMHSSALTRKKIIFNAGEEDVPVSATSDEYALAGKGFNQQVEKQYQTENPHLDFSWVDKMEQFRVSPVRIQQFLSVGKVIPRGGQG